MSASKPAASCADSPHIKPQVIGIATVLWLFGVLSFVAAALGVILFWTRHEFLGLEAAVAGGVLGSLLLALVRIIDSLHEISCRLKNIEEKLEE